MFIYIILKSFLFFLSRSLNKLIMSQQGKLWERKQIPYNANYVQDSLSSFMPQELHDEDMKLKWVQFSKNFSEMSLDDVRVADMPFEQFTDLRSILAFTLGYLSSETNAQRQKIAQLENQEKRLDIQLKKLDIIQQQNKDKERDINEKIKKLQRQRQRLQEQDIDIGLDEFSSMATREH